MCEMSGIGLWKGGLTEEMLRGDDPALPPIGELAGTIDGSAQGQTSFTAQAGVREEDGPNENTNGAEHKPDKHKRVVVAQVVEVPQAHVGDLSYGAVVEVAEDELGRACEVDDNARWKYFTL